MGPRAVAAAGRAVEAWLAREVVMRAAVVTAGTETVAAMTEATGVGAMEVDGEGGTGRLVAEAASPAEMASRVVWAARAVVRSG